MKSLILFGIIGLLPIACATSSKQDKPVYDKFLVNIQYKIIDHGYFKFIELKDSVPIKEIIFHYDIDKKNNKFRVSQIENKIVSSLYGIKDYHNSQEWNEKERNTRREKYYKIIHEKFLYLNNEQKFNLLDSLKIMTK